MKTLNNEAVAYLLEISRKEAQVMICAHELLAALNDLAMECAWSGNITGELAASIARARAAIAKAEGAK
jgi:hypothetical protein